jgi:putative ABC transport system substrate-binding protein
VAFVQGLRDLGYVEGRTIVIEYRWAHGKPEWFPEFTEQLVQLKVDVIVTSTGLGGRPAKRVTSSIPVVMPAVADPVGDGLVVSLARPGGNITGLSLVSPELSAKRLELRKETFPRVSRVAVLHDQQGT